jgi:hypothetical protein
VGRFRPLIEPAVRWNVPRTAPSTFPIVVNTSARQVRAQARTMDTTAATTLKRAKCQCTARSGSGQGGVAPSDRSPLARVRTEGVNFISFPRGPGGVRGTEFTHRLPRLVRLLKGLSIRFDQEFLRQIGSSAVASSKPRALGIRRAGGLSPACRPRKAPWHRTIPASRPRARQRVIPPRSDYLVATRAPSAAYPPRSRHAARVTIRSRWPRPVLLSARNQGRQSRPDIPP